MRKLYTTPEYKRKHKRRLEKINRKLRWKKNPRRPPKQKKTKEQPYDYRVLVAPADMRLLENTEECLLFFNKLRGNEYLRHIPATYRNKEVFIVDMSLEHVTKIDYAAISILTSISDEMKEREILLKTNFPADTLCKMFVIESGFLDHMYDALGRKFPKTEKSDLIFFEKGGKYLSESDQRKISGLVEKAIEYLGGNKDCLFPLKMVIKEICGNSIEWSGATSKLWLFGVKYEPTKVLFTLTDIGCGILDTIYIKHFQKITDALLLRQSVQILNRAFTQKYGSSSQEINRNKGLPAIKATADAGIMGCLKLITNNVILHFGDNSLSRSFNGNNSFDGTFYQWELTKECTHKKWSNENESN